MTTIQEFNQIDGRISSLYHAAALKMGLSDSEFRILYTLAVNEPGYLQFFPSRVLMPISDRKLAILNLP